jgi:hypothetical protein
VAGDHHVVIAPKALVSAGVEVRVVSDDIAVGFAPSDHQGTVVRLDPDTLSVTGTANAHSRYAVRRVTPTVTGKSLGALLDADRKGDAMQGRRTVATEPPLQLGAADGALQWAKTNGAPVAKLWDLDGDGDVDAVRVAIDDGAPGKTMGVVFRRGNAVDVGLAAPASEEAGAGDAPMPAALGGITRFASAGPAIGSPVIAIQDGVVIAAWADRASADEPWRVRTVGYKVGDTPGAATTFAPPAGGPGEQTMSPAVVAVPGKRFMLVWTEGAQSRHDVRALTLGENGAPIGASLVISAEGSNAGQAQVAIAPSGRGVVAYLESTDDGFQVAATPIDCGSAAR